MPTESACLARAAVASPFSMSLVMPTIPGTVGISACVTCVAMLHACDQLCITKFDELDDVCAYTPMKRIYFLTQQHIFTCAYVFVYFNKLGPNRENFIAEAASHEMGHNMGNTALFGLVIAAACSNAFAPIDSVTLHHTHILVFISYHGARDRRVAHRNRSLPRRSDRPGAFGLLLDYV